MRMRDNREEKEAHVTGRFITSSVIIGHGTEIDPRSLRLETRDRWLIPNEQVEKEDPELILQEGLEMVKRDWPTARLRSLSGLYNCVGMVFAGRRTHVECRHVERILRGDGYRRLPRPGDAQVGDVAVYRTSNDGKVRHVGIVVGLGGMALTPDDDPDRRITILSKWGDGGEFFHPIRSVPTVYGEAVEIWTDRRAT